MKKLFLLFVLFSSLAFSQTNGFTYQAVILNPLGEELPGYNNSRSPLVNQNICLSFDILNASSQTEYKETIHTKTDEFGMVNVIIGKGSQIAGYANGFNGIVWNGTPKSLEVDVDTSGFCNYFNFVSKQPFTAVPYALFAANAAVPGLPGPQGIPGPMGATGATGSQGPQGIQGPIGLTGSQGPQGVQGPIGLTGPQGVQGPLGLTGATGPQGPIGLTGATGAQGQIGLTGATGPQGIQGPAGANGLSAYDIAVQNGYTGTQAQWLSTTTGAAGTNGVDGKNTLVKTTIEPSGVNCATGGTKVEVGLDANSNGILDASEINTTLTKYICNGLDGATGPQGVAGTNGATGPQGIQGVAGTTGPQGPAGANGLSAYDIAVQNGYTGTQAQWLSTTTGAAGTNGVDGKNTLVKTTIEPSGVNCATGGTKVEVGLDANSNGILDASEINTTLTKYICNGLDGATGPQGVAGTNGATGPQGVQGVAGDIGPQGPAGANGLSAYDIAVQNGYTGTQAQWLSTTTGAAGTNGVDGKNTLVKTTIEPAGINCATGGTKIQVGLDTNSNGVLDASEINATLTKYVCNGAVGATGAQGVAGVAGANGPQGIQGITGPAGTNGTNGNTVLNGTIAPTAGTGVNGDFYINTSTKTIFGPKAAGAWPATGTAIVGATGPAGPQGAQGVAGAIGPIGLTGPTGPVGTQGIQGIQGNAGATGATGPQGPAGSNASITIGAISGTSTANGATITSGVLSMTPADATNGGVVTNGTQTIAGAKTFTNAVAGNNTATATIAGFAANINAQTGTTYTLTATDNGKIITFSNACTVTVPSSLFAGFNCFLLQKGTGQVTIVGATGVTVNNRRTFTKTAGTYAIATILALNTTTFISSGDMSN